MKRNIYLLGLGLILAFLCGCNRMNHDGAIDGFWIIESIENTSDGSVTVPSVISSISIQLEIMQVRNANTGEATAEIFYDKKTDTLVADFRSGNISADALAQYGIFDNPVTFHTDADRKKLILTSDKSIITCKRY